MPRWRPLNARERRAWALWAPFLLLGALLDVEEAHRSPDPDDHGTLSEACRSVRRRAGRGPTGVVWWLFATWFWHHISHGDPQFDQPPEPQQEV